jgi:hypothetical protein
MNINDDQDSLQDSSATWCKLVDRGGLCHMRNETYALFMNIEIMGSHPDKVINLDARWKEKMKGEECRNK